MIILIPFSPKRGGDFPASLWRISPPLNASHSVTSFDIFARFTHWLAGLSDQLRIRERFAFLCLAKNSTSFHSYRKPSLARCSYSFFAGMIPLSPYDFHQPAYVYVLTGHLAPSGCLSFLFCIVYKIKKRDLKLVPFTRIQKIITTLELYLALVF